MIYLSIVYVLIVILSNIVSNQIIDIGIITDAGTLLFPAVFTIRDYMHKKDKTLTKKITNLTIILNVFTSMFILFILQFKVVGENNLIGISSTFQIVLASVIAFYISLKVDYIIYEKTESILKSNLVSILIDTVIFCILAFYKLDLKIIIGIIISNLLLKYFITIIHVILLKVIKK